MIENRYIVIRKRGNIIMGIYKTEKTAQEWVDNFDPHSDYYIDEIDWEV